MKQNINALLKQADKLEDKACELALKEVERMARNILKTKPHLDHFVMAMGSCFFVDKKDNIVSTECQLMNKSYNYYTATTFKYFEPLNKFINKYDDRLKLTGCPMRFTATGKKITNW